jgi:hypothetical protein
MLKAACVYKDLAGSEYTHVNAGRIIGVMVYAFETQTENTRHAKS